MPLSLTLNYDSGVPVYRQIYDAVLAALASGMLARDEQLPTIHKLAQTLEINPNTVSRAYRELERDGYLVAKRGKGTFPAQKEVPTSAGKESILRQIFERAMAEAARHHISPAEVVAFFGGK